MHHIHLSTEQIALGPVVLTSMIVGLLCSLLSVIVVLKRLAFVGQGISHAGFGGIGTAMVLGIPPGITQDLLVLGFCVVAAILIGVLSRRHKLEADSAIGVILVGAMAWGALASSLAAHLAEQPWYRRWFGPIEDQPGFHAVLFGSVLEVGMSDLVLAAGVAVLVLGGLVGYFKQIVFFTFDETASRVFGVRSGLVYYLLLIALSLVIVVSIRLVGFLLVSALLVIPGAAATMLSRRLGMVLSLAVAMGLLGTLGGLGVSLAVGFIPAGPSMVLVLCGLLGVAAGGHRLLG